MEGKTKLENLLFNHFSPQVVKSYVAHPLKSDGQYFTSCVKRVKIILENDEERSEVDLIVKELSSEENEIETNSKLKFKKERVFYQLVPTEYNRIQTNNKLPEQKLFPLFFTASEEIIVLEDLYAKGYYICDNYLGEVKTKLVLQELAKFHATGIALKLSKPNIFEERLASVVIPALRNDSNPDRDEVNKEFRLEINKLLRSNDNLKDYAEAIDLLLRRIDNTKLPTPSEPFSTLLHNDLWRGNIMFRDLSTTSESKDVKFIDFQTVIFNSPARDLIYFLFSSVEDGVLSKFSDLLKFYHVHFINNLSGLGVNSSDFALDKLMNEVNRYGPSKLKHILLLFKVLSSVNNGDLSFVNCLQRVVILFRKRGWV